MFALDIRLGVFDVCYYFIIDCLFHLHLDINLYYLYGKNATGTGIAWGTPVRILQGAVVRWNSSRQRLCIGT